MNPNNKEGFNPKETRSQSRSIKTSQRAARRLAAAAAALESPRVRRRDRSRIERTCSEGIGAASSQDLCPLATRRSSAQTGSYQLVQSNH